MPVSKDSYRWPIRASFSGIRQVDDCHSTRTIVDRKQDIIAVLPTCHCADENSVENVARASLLMKLLCQLRVSIFKPRLKEFHSSPYKGHNTRKIWILPPELRSYSATGTPPSPQRNFHNSPVRGNFKISATHAPHIILWEVRVSLIQARELYYHRIGNGTILVGFHRKHQSVRLQLILDAIEESWLHIKGVL